MMDKVIFIAAILANIAMAVFAFYLSINAYGSDARMATLLAIPPILALIALFQGEGLEERRLKKKLRKAVLKKQLSELKDFTD